MAAREKHVVADIVFRTNRPTRLTFAELYTWVIWQFPRQKGTGLCGAVRPPIAEHGWFPALIQSKEKRVQVYAHLDETFSTPEAAADYFNSSG